ncbi:unnamed protein product [Mycena citricolor]|uniref:Aminotransferase class I/classII large domain-containing protein n=1 Tax=Mycena citricolor TaxID=2018698 RepID=A0AAD2K4L9_9AGAR|nr:unnamed protein product [Mycena citricolor]
MLRAPVQLRKRLGAWRSYRTTSMAKGAAPTRLEGQLSRALESREKRLIRRRLPQPGSLAVGPVDFNSNDYLSLSTSPVLRSRFLERLQQAPEILGSGGSRLLVNGTAHAALESRLARFFRSPAALLFNSGFDANVGLFSCLPQPGDVVVYDEYIHASVHDGMRASRCAARHAFAHNSVSALRGVLAECLEERPDVRDGQASVFVAVESLYSMDGTFSPLTEIVGLLEELFPHGNAYLIVDEAHSTGLYGPQGRGRVIELGLEDKVLARLYTFGKALAATGAVIITSPLIRDYLLNYARSLIYTTSLSSSNIIAADTSFDLLDDGTAHKLADHALSLSAYFVESLRQRLPDIPPHLLSLPAHLSDPTVPPSPIIPVMTCRPRPLSNHLASLGLNARPITWPTVPKGADRVRVCLHAGNTRSEVDRLVEGMLSWAVEAAKDENVKTEHVKSKL